MHYIIIFYPMFYPMDMQVLKPYLDNLYKTYDHAFLSSDPLEFLHGFKDDRNREIVGLIASSLAYGRVEQIKKSISYILDVMGFEPYGFTMDFKNPSRYKKAFSGFTHRFNNGDDIRCLLLFIKEMFERSGSIRRFFLEGYRAGDCNVKDALISFSIRVLKFDSHGIYGRGKLPDNAGVRFFFPSPKDGSPCKRLNLYLRWMVRKDSLDFGIWKGVSPSKLIIPLDTHVARISRYIGLTRRVAPDWNMAEEITENLKKLDPFDPVKYDFSISRLGILDECKKGGEKCAGCQIKNLCIIR